MKTSNARLTDGYGNVVGFLIGLPGQLIRRHAIQRPPEHAGEIIEQIEQDFFIGYNAYPCDTFLSILCGVRRFVEVCRNQAITC
ncbi:MAG: hypothetical protein JXA42_05060 [Anaerolineales bacterium]|nr:hypothetical protein [Anaerolineales bacterium]